MTAYVKTSEIAAALGLSKKEVLEKSRRENWPCVGRKDSLAFQGIHLPGGVRRALSDRAPPEAAVEASGSLGQLADKAREAAKNRSALIHEYRQSRLNPADFVEAYNAGQSSAYLLEKLGKVSVRTLYRWLRDHKEAGGAETAALAALAPRYGCKKNGAGATLHPVERALLRKFWLRSEQPAMAHAWRNLLLAYPHSRCTYQTAARFLQAISPAERDLWPGENAL